MVKKNQSKTTLLSKVIGKTLSFVQPILDTAGKASIEPFTDVNIMTPRWNEFRYNWTHYGLFFSDLPEPHRFLNIMILLGTPSARAFHHDYLIYGDQRHSATFFSGTAACDNFLLKAYVLEKDCFTKADGSELILGEELKITGKYPDIHLFGKYNGLEIDIDVNIKNQASWFLKNIVYDHLSLLATYKGQIIHQGVKLPIKGLCTYEYARCSFGLHGLRDSYKSPKYMIPINFFTYQILKIDEDIQVLLTKADVLGKPSCYCIHVRKLGEYSEYYDNVEFKVNEYQTTETIGMDGSKTYLPKTLSWSAKDKFGKTVLSIKGEVDTPYNYGHGRGYVTSYNFNGSFKGNQISGRCYMEYVSIEF